MGAFDHDPGIRPQFHTFVEDRAAWDVITDDLPQFAQRRNVKGVGRVAQIDFFLQKIIVPKVGMVC